MKNLPPRLLAKYNDLLTQNLPKEQHAPYNKWLRFYWDFCFKYHHKPSEHSSLPLFMAKLKSKHQPDEFRQQATLAVELYFKEIASYLESSAVDKDESTANDDISSNSILTNHGHLADFVVNEPITTYVAKGHSWINVYDALAGEIKIRHYSPKTFKSYQSWVRKFQTFVRSKEVILVCQQDAKLFLTNLAVEKQVAASTQNQAFNALLFLFRYILKTSFNDLKDTPRAKRSQYVPVVLSRPEVNAVFSHLSPKCLLPAQLLYGCGLRISECLNLRLQDFNFDLGLLTIHHGKGGKSRSLPLPQSIMAVLLIQVEDVKRLHKEDITNGFAGVFLPDSLSSKYKNAAFELAWQWFFPARALTQIPNTQEFKRYHLHETVLQKCIRSATKKAQLIKRVTPHTFRHSFASHLLQNHYDIRTIQVLMGHSDVKTTMIYVQTVPSMTLKDAKSPLDFDETKAINNEG